ncbi:MAG: NAD(P)H-hydrate epimerase [Phycisphaerales bacterium]|nr:NAD(P)H-hydrate epimerase [Phycisphaerales bacterium]
MFAWSAPTKPKADHDLLLYSTPEPLDQSNPKRLAGSRGGPDNNGMSNKSTILRLSVAQTRAVDRYAIDVLGIPGVVLMENAGRNAADLIERRLKRVSRPATRRIAVVCGKGNNGGDGFVIARHLAHRGYPVDIDLFGRAEELAGDAAINYAIIEKMGLPIRRLHDRRTLAAAARRWRKSAAVVDALLGTGFSGQVREPIASVIAGINALRGPLIVAVDVPSGLNADTGIAEGPAIEADMTVTFLAAKNGYAQTTARKHLGRLHVVNIGAPTALIRKRLGI